ncbi:MAG: hypothetical protein IPN11_14225 [Opitutaceae bacterium]|nr:hypothetical protein [Opitutaceae bacterium]
MHLLTSVRRMLFIASGLLALGAAAFAAEPAVKTFDLPAGPAAETLKQFAAQSGREIVFSPQAVTQVTTQPVKGELTPAAALDAMLADTGLMASQDSKTGAFAVRKGDLPNAQRAAQVAKASVRPETSAQTQEGVVRLEQYEVLGSRIRQTEAMGPTPLNSYDSEYIRASGALTLSDFLRSLPQTYSGVAIGRSSAPSDLSMLGGTRVEGQLPIGQVIGGSPSLATECPSNRRFWR